MTPLHEGYSSAVCRDVQLLGSISTLLHLHKLHFSLSQEQGEKSPEGRLPGSPGLQPGRSCCVSSPRVLGVRAAVSSSSSEHPRCSRRSPLSSQGVHAWAGEVNTATPHPFPPRPSIPSSPHPPPRADGEPRCCQARVGFICFT